MKTIFVVIDEEVFQNVAVADSEKKALEQAAEKDVYFKNKDEFFKYYEQRYFVEEWIIKEEKNEN